MNNPWSILLWLTLIFLLGAIALRHRRAMAKVAQRAEWSDLTLRTLPTPLIVLDQLGHVCWFNKAAEQLFRYSSHDVDGKHISQLLVALDSAGYDTLDRLLHAPDASRESFDAGGQCSDGTSFTAQIRKRRLEHAAEIGWVLAVRDLTPEHQIKSALQRYVTQLVMTKDALQQHNKNLELTVQERTEQLQIAKDAADKANSAKSEFLANMSHELRTPLHGILSFARFGVQRYDKVDREKLLTYFQRIEATGNTLLALLNELLDLSKLEAGCMTLNSEAVQLHQLISEIADEYGALIRERGLTLEVPREATIEPVWGDRQRLAQVIRNLLNNAVKFTPRDGLIQISTTTSAEMVMVTIQDTGPGISDEECAAVFDKFVQSKQTSSGAGGTGLGLSICREIMLLHQGGIRAEPTHGRGALIRFWLPRWMQPDSCKSTDQETPVDNSDLVFA